MSTWFKVFWAGYMVWILGFEATGITHLSGDPWFWVILVGYLAIVFAEYRDRIRHDTRRHVH